MGDYMDIMEHPDVMALIMTMRRAMDNSLGVAQDIDRIWAKETERETSALSKKLQIRETGKLGTVTYQVGPCWLQMVVPTIVSVLLQRPEHD